VAGIRRYVGDKLLIPFNQDEYLIVVDKFLPVKTADEIESF